MSLPASAFAVVALHAWSARPDPAPPAPQAPPEAMDPARRRGLGLLPALLASWVAAHRHPQQ